MSAPRWIRQLDALDHNERQAELVRQGRALIERDYAELAAALSNGSVHERQYGLQLAQARRDLSTLWRALGDPSISTRHMAAGWLGRLAESVPASVLVDLDAQTRSVLVRSVLRRRRTDLAESMVEALAACGLWSDAAVLLSACSGDFIVQRLDASPWPEPVWPRLARYRGDLLASWLTAAFDATDLPDAVWSRFPNAMWRSLAEARPEVVASWVERFTARERPLPRAVEYSLPVLIRWSASTVVAWLGERVAEVAQRASLLAGTTLARRLERVDDDTLAPLSNGLLRLAPERWASLVRMLPPPRRGQLFERGAASMTIATEWWPDAVLETLPEALRDREATRMLTLKLARERESLTRHVWGFRAIEDARAPLETMIRSAAHAGDRLEAYVALIRSTVRSRRGMAETLAFLTRAKNDQDPVRAAIVGALGTAPGHRFVGHEPALEVVLAPVFEARDTSHTTRQGVALVAKRLIVASAAEPRSPAFALGLQLLERLAGQRGVIDLPLLHRNLPRGAEHAIVAALDAWLDADTRREQFSGLFRLWAALGKRAWNVPSLAQRLEKLIWKGPKSIASTAAELWTQDRGRKDVRVRALLERDTSAIMLGSVYLHALRRRQTALPLRFAAKPPRGRFYDGRVISLPVVIRGLQRWSDALDRAYLAAVDAAERDPKRDTWGRVALVRMRSRVLSTEVNDLRPYLQSSDVNLVEAALAEMAATDRPAPALPILLDHLDGDRARVAMYAMPRVARRLPAAVVIDAVAGVLARPQRKITVEKEAVRLLGQYPTPPALALLQELWRQPLHRDVRIAALHAARANLAHADAWALLRDAATDASDEVARAVVEVSVSNVPELYRGRYARLMGAVVEHPRPVVRQALVSALASGWGTVARDVVFDVARCILVRLDALDPWRAVLPVLVEIAASPANHSALVELVASLADAAAHDRAPAGDVDQLPWQRLVAVVEALSERFDRRLQPMQASLAARLELEPRTWHLASRARLASLPNTALAGGVLALLAHAPSWSAALALTGVVAEVAAKAARQWTEHEALAVLDALWTEDARARTIAIRALAVWGPAWGWGAAWIDRLARGRLDPDVEVELAARSVVVNDPALTRV